MELRDKCVYCLYLFLFICIALVFKKVWSGGDIFSISIDPLISQSVHDEFEKYLLCALNEQPDINSSIKTIKDQYSFIEQIIIEKNELRKRHVSIAVSAPWLRIDDTFILLRNGAIVERSILDESIIRSLNSFSMKISDRKINPLVYTWLKQQNKSLFNTFKITIKSPLEIVLSDPISKVDQIICDADQKITSSLITQATSILNYAKKQNNFKKTDSWTIDIRFSGHIVLRKNKGKGCV